MSGRFSYQKGRKNEHRSMAVLEAAGYLCMRSAGSHSVFDIIGIGSQDTVCVQVKSRDWPGTVEMETLMNVVRHDRCRIIIHRWRDRQRLPDVKEL